MQRTWTFMTIALVAIGAAFILNISPIVNHRMPSVFISSGHVEGMAILHENILYTLNYEQQKEVIEIINKAIPAKDDDQQEGEAPGFSKLVIYLFDKPEIILTPIVFSKGNLIFTLSGTDAEGYLQEVSGGKLRAMISRMID